MSATADAAAAGAGVEIDGVAKAYGKTPVLHDVTTTFPGRGIVAILGPSGSGKTTLLRLIAGFERADAGTIALGGRVVDGKRVHVRARAAGDRLRPAGRRASSRT